MAIPTPQMVSHIDAGAQGTKAFCVPWCSETVRFNNELQIVDLTDCFATLSRTPGSARVSQHKYFSVGLKDTAERLGMSQDELLYTAKWNSTRQKRTCIKAFAAAKFFRMLTHVRYAVELADILYETYYLCQEYDVAGPTTEKEVGNQSHTSKPASKKDDNDSVTIYALVYLPTGKRVYTGRTKDPNSRLKQHAAKSSKCRLVRNAFKKYGRKAFGLEPIMRCRTSDAAANESFWIQKNQTLWPDGYNLMHGSVAGEEEDKLNTALVVACTGVIPFNDPIDEALAMKEVQDEIDVIIDLDESSSEATQHMPWAGPIKGIPITNTFDKSHNDDSPLSVLQAMQRSDKRKLDREELAHDRKVEQEELVNKIQCLRSLGEHDTASKLVQKLVCM